MTETGLLEQVLGGVPLLASYANMIKLEAALALASRPGAPPGRARRLGRRGRRAPARALAARQCGIRAAGVDGGRLVADLGELGASATARVLLYRLGGERFTDRVLLAWTRSPQGAADRPWHRLATLPARWSAPAFPLKAADFMARGVPKGPRLGAALAAAEEAWIAAGISGRGGGSGGNRRCSGGRDAVIALPPFVPAKAGTQTLDLDSQHKRFTRVFHALCAGMSGGEARLAPCPVPHYTAG